MSSSSPSHHPLHTWAVYILKQVFFEETPTHITLQSCELMYDIIYTMYQHLKQQKGNSNHPRVITFQDAHRSQRITFTITRKATYLLCYIQQWIPGELGIHNTEEYKRNAAFRRQNPRKMDKVAPCPLSWYHVKKPSACDDTSTLILSTLEYVTAEIMELSGKKARNGYCSAIRPGHIIAAIRGDPELHQLMIKLGLSSHFDTPPSIDMTYWPLIQTKDRMHAWDLRYSWYHQSQHINPTSPIYQQHLNTFLDGICGDQYYFRRFHIRPVQYLGHRGFDYGTMSTYDEMEGPLEGDFINTDMEKHYYYANFDIVDAHGKSHPYHIEVHPLERKGVIYHRMTCEIVAEMECDESTNRGRLTYTASNPHSYTPWGHLSNLTPSECDSIYGCFTEWGAQQPRQRDDDDDEPIHDPIATLELERLMSCAHRLAYVNGGPIHPAMYTANHPLSVRVPFQQAALKQSLLTISSSAKHDPALIHATTSLAHIAPLLSLIASYAPTSDIPYLPGISDTVCDTDLSFTQWSESLNPSYDRFYEYS